MDEDRCENCYWYWTGASGYECHRPRQDGDKRCRRPVDDKDNCGWFEPKVEKPEIDEYEQYQKEWN